MKKEKKFQPNMDTKVALFWKARRQKGLGKRIAAREVGIREENATNYERLPTFRALDEKYKDKLLKKMGMEDVADEQIKVIKQDRDLGAKLNAIKFYTERVEPEVREESDDEKMIVVLRA